ncbi:MAG TPA: alpha/beta hydrolase, partial [Burkholderiales bacterium]|nr:alpha/beta hydrolase [Burkholderiales bacterium]
MFLSRALRILVSAVLLAAALVGAVAIGFAAQAWWRHPDLDPWHTLRLVNEFKAGRDAPRTLGEYMVQEERLFAELRHALYAAPARTHVSEFERYGNGSLAARIALDTVGNRTHELAPAAPRGAAVMLHGLSDAPYSLETVGRLLHERGFHVVWLRLPGHGTIPGALRDVAWEDWLAATSLALRHAGEQAPGKPLYVAGYSTGAPLALLHTLRAMEDQSLVMPTRLLLFSPAIGVSRFAVMTNVAALLAPVPGLEKAAWLDVLPEYDPYKYNSFPVNAANQIYGLTRALEAGLAQAQARGLLERMPPITAFQSLVDSTILAADLATRLFKRLPANKGHELVVFDVNRSELLSSLIAPGPKHAFDRVARVPALPFRLTVVGNASRDSAEVVEWIREPGQHEAVPHSTGLAWPNRVFSLGHLAIPTPIDDPMYGLTPRSAPDGLALPLGRGAPSGEAGGLGIPLGQ